MTDINNLRKLADMPEAEIVTEGDADVALKQASKMLDALEKLDDRIDKGGFLGRIVIKQGFTGEQKAVSKHLSAAVNELQELVQALSINTEK